MANGQDQRASERYDRIDVADLILRERLARDNFNWDKMAAYYHADSVVDLSWYHGDGAGFVERSKANANVAQFPPHVPSGC
jgi:hypothetical protein